MKAKSNFTEKRTVNTVRDFKGIYNSPSARDGDIVEAYNISTRSYPAISSSLPQIIESSFGGDVNSVLGSSDKVFYSSKNKFVYDGVIKGEISEGRKTFCTLNGYIAIFPDKKYYLNKTVVYRPYNGNLLECDTNEQYENVIDLIAISESAPKHAGEGDIYFNPAYKALYTYTNGEWVESQTLDIFNRYRVKAEEFGNLDTEYVWKETETAQYRMECIENDEFIRFSFVKSSAALNQNFKGLKVGDVVTITGVDVSASMNEDIDKGLSEGTVITDIGKSYITVKNTSGVTLNGFQISETLRIKRFVPTLNCVTKVGNRLWGASDKTIYASAENDPCVWSKKNGLSDRTVAINTGISGKIIACADFGGVPVFFTESSIIKVLSVYDGYKLSITPAVSVSPENTNSIALVADSLYYVSSCGVMCYKGTVPSKISSDIGLSFVNTVGGSDGSKYFISDSKNTFIYDPETKLWSAENGGFTSFAMHGSSLLAVGKYYSQMAIFRMISESEEFSVEFAHYPGNTQIIFAPFYENTHQKKTFSRLIIGTCTEPSAITDIYVSFDGKPYVFAGCIRNKEGVCVSEIPLVPVRADYMQVKIISHSGKFDLLSLSREFVTHENYN